MASKQELDNLIGAYKEAFDLVGKAAVVMSDVAETSTAATEIFGAFGRFRPSAIASELYGTVSDLFSARCDLNEVTPDQ